ncbi:MAG: hypothetical protein KGM47_09410 [Acidobacteriota bacterium]|nr:hypothetical protein [Acidobacteriota bacterium]
MPEDFEFKRTDRYVQRLLTQQEINQVQHWQSDRLDYQFSFHTQHEAGWPCYLKEPDGPNRNLPKINLKVPTNPPQLLQGDSVRNNNAGADFRDVIRANVLLFQKLARAYYEPDDVQNVALPQKVVRFTCTTSRQAKAVDVKLPSRAQPIPDTFWLNMQRYAHKPDCPLHKNSRCMEGAK